MAESQITVYGAYWCPDCRRAKQFLGEQFIPYTWVDIEQDQAAEQFVLAKNNGKRIIPTIIFADGSLLVEPSNAELARKLKLTTEASMSFYDLIIIGGGPAGLTAAIYAAREGAKTLLIERSGLGGQAGITVGIDNFPGFPEGIGGLELAARMVEQARRFNVEILQAQQIGHVAQHDGYACAVNDADQHYHSGALLIATGASYRRTEAPGEADFIGAGIHFCATCDGPFYKGAKAIVVVGGGNSAVEEGLHLTHFADKVILLVRGDQLTASQVAIEKATEPNSRIDVRFNTAVEAFEGDNAKLKRVKVRNRVTGETSTIEAAAAFIFIGQTPNSAFLQGDVAMDKQGFILTGHDLGHSATLIDGYVPAPFETSLPGIFAAGDVRHGSIKQVASAVGEGAAAAIAVREFLRKR